MKINISREEADAIIAHAKVHLPLLEKLSPALLRDLQGDSRTGQQAPTEIPVGAPVRASAGGPVPAFPLDPTGGVAGGSAVPIYGGSSGGIGGAFKRMAASLPARVELQAAFQRIADERMEQIRKGYDAAHDDAHGNGDLSKAALAYLAEYVARLRRPVVSLQPPPCWPFRAEEFRSPADSVRLLVKTVTLAVCELARLLRLEVMEKEHAAQVAEEEPKAGELAAALSRMPKDSRPTPGEILAGVRELRDLRTPPNDPSEDSAPEQEVPIMVQLEAALGCLDDLLDPARLHEAARIAYEAQQAVLTGGSGHAVPWGAFSTHGGYLHGYSAIRAAAETVVRELVEMTKIQMVRAAGASAVKDFVATAKSKPRPTSN